MRIVPVSGLALVVEAARLVVVGALSLDRVDDEAVLSSTLVLIAPESVLVLTVVEIVTSVVTSVVTAEAVDKAVVIFWAPTLALSAVRSAATSTPRIIRERERGGGKGWTVREKPSSQVAVLMMFKRNMRCSKRPFTE